MKWKLGKNPEYDDRRIKRTFLVLPTILATRSEDRELRWLEWANIEQAYGMNERWVNMHWGE